MALEGSFPPVLNLNVGGFVYTTPLNTFTRYPSSMLGRMFSGRQKIDKDSKGNYFIDGDGSLFRHVLNFLRTGELCLPQSFDEFEQLSAEARFYQLDNLIEAIKTRCDGLGVITITHHSIGHLCLTGRGKLLKEVFTWCTLPTVFGFGENRCTSITINIPKADAFDLLYRHGFQLEGCNGQRNDVEYIFGRKN